MLDVYESLKILSSSSLPIAKSFLAHSKDESIKYARELGYPVVLKLVSAELIHKTEASGVVINIQNEGELVRAYDAITNKTSQLKIKVKGMLIQEQLSGIELIIGVKKDPVFGQVIMFGIGGVFVELLKDVSFRVCPIDIKEASSMIGELKARKLLEGYRGKEGVDLKILALIISKVSKFAVDKNLIEMDINPLIMKSGKALIVDARIDY